jgi:hypothetical protein
MSHFSLVPTTELEAVNIVLASVGESPVNSIATTTTTDVVQAKAILSEVNRRVQMRGWYFNTDYNVTLSRDAGNEIPLATNVLAVRVPGRDIVVRGGRLYDRVNRVYTFTDNITNAETVVLLDFTDLSEAGRNYVTQLACQQMQRTVQGQYNADQENTQELRMAYADFVNEDMAQSKMTMGNSEQDMFNMTFRNKLQR